MPNKLSPVSRPIQQLADGQTDTKPAKGFQRVAARIAKPLKGLGVWGGGRPAGAPAAAASVNHSARALDNATGRAVEHPISAEDLVMLERSFARTTASSKVDGIFDSKPTLLNECKAKFLDVRKFILDVDVALRRCEKELSALPAFDEKNKSRLQAEISELGKMLTQANVKKTAYASDVGRAFDAEIESIEHDINNYKSQLHTSSKQEQQRLETRVAEAKFEILDLKVNRNKWLDSV